jgi:hypothetical protein
LLFDPKLDETAMVRLSRARSWGQTLRVRVPQVERQEGLEPHHLADVLPAQHLVDVVLLVDETLPVTQEVLPPSGSVPLVAAARHPGAEVVGHSARMSSAVGSLCSSRKVSPDRLADLVVRYRPGCSISHEVSADAVFSGR